MKDGCLEKKKPKHLEMLLDCSSLQNLLLHRPCIEVCVDWIDRSVRRISKGVFSLTMTGTFDPIHGLGSLLRTFPIADVSAMGRKRTESVWLGEYLAETDLVYLNGVSN